MDANKRQVLIRVQPDTCEKLKAISDQNHRSVSNQLEYLMLQFIKEYEKENGLIPLGNGYVTQNNEKGNNYYGVAGNHFNTNVTMKKNSPLARGKFLRRNVMSQVRTRKRGKAWSFIFEAGIINGKRKVVEKGGYTTKVAAYKAGVEKYTDFMHGNIGITSEAITLKSFMTNWLENVVALNVKPKSMQTYQTLFGRQICLHLGEVKLQELTPAMLDAWLKNCQRRSYRLILCRLCTLLFITR